MKNNKALALLIVVILIVAMGGVFCYQKLVVDKRNNTNNTQKKDPEPEPEPRPGIIMVKDNDLIFSFLKLENKGENFMYSPLSIRYAFQVLAEGAEDESKEQLDKMLGEYNTNKYLPIEDHLGFGNAVFIRDTYFGKVKTDYIDTVKDKYDAEIIKDKFADAKNVNKWIEDKTMGMIKDMLNDNQVNDPDVKMIIANALSIDMEWVHGFDGENTHSDKFTKKDGKEINVQMMHETFKDDNLSYYVDDDVNVVSLKLKQYDDIQFDVYAIMPKGDINDYINNVTTDSFNELIGKMKPASSYDGGVSLSIPRFDYYTKLNLNNDLIALGVSNIFSQDKAHLYKIIDKSEQPLYVSDVLHDSKVEFSEKGVKAAAATVIVMKDNAMIVADKEPLRIKFDKPFIYVIKDNKTNAIWFVGAVFEPELVK